MRNSAVRIPESLYEEIQLSEKERIAQTKMLMRLFGLWHLSVSQQAICIGLSPKTRTTINSYRSGKAILPLSKDVQDRVANFFYIHKSLRRLFYGNDQLIYEWIRRPNKAFENYSPIEVICRDGYLGIVAVKDYLTAALMG